MNGRELVDDVLFGGLENEFRLWLDRPVDLVELRAEVIRRAAELRVRGLHRGGSLALWLPPSLAYVTALLAGWRAGAQVVLLDYRLTEHEVDRALARLRPQLVVSAASGQGGPLRGHHLVSTRVEEYPGLPACGEHVLVQLSSGSTGPSKVIGRTAAGLVAELDRYRRIPGMPGPGERVLVLSSLTHTFGLVGGLLHGMYNGIAVSVPEQVTSTGIVEAVAGGREPTTVLGVPVHIGLMAAVSAPPALPQLARAVSGGELIDPRLPEMFVQRYGVPVGECYGMTEVGVIAMDLTGRHRPAAGPPAPGVRVRVDAGELLVHCPDNPYLGETDPTRWVDGWLRTRDAARLSDGGAVQVLGRLDSQVTVGGINVDLSEVEHTVAGLPGVTEAVVVFDRRIEAYLALRDPAELGAVETALAERLAPYKRPRRLHVVARLPRTSSGKRVRDLAALRASRATLPVPAATG